MRYVIVAAALAAALLDTSVADCRLGRANRPAASNVPAAEPPPAVQPPPRKLVLNATDVDVDPPAAGRQVLLPPPTPPPPPRLIRIIRGSSPGLLAPPYPSPWPPEAEPPDPDA